MIKILHTGDIHLGSLTGPEKNGINLRREDTLRCMDEIVQTAREEQPDLTIIAGDLFNRSRVWADTALDDVRDAVERLLRPLCECSGHVVLLFGTANHDNPKAFENIFTVTNDLDNLKFCLTGGLQNHVESRLLGGSSLACASSGSCNGNSGSSRFNAILLLEDLCEFVYLGNLEVYQFFSKFLYVCHSCKLIKFCLILDCD